ncbi:hypothetical protein AKJ45_02495 [candidate division MSBL1 archaeon SCGC-AAA261F19]|uniref:Prephenate/arogenate dehydrogenase domain-containing protein n=2 Tax=candidate division MSBL1 TaxID=215777 RepID=A0A133V9M0_9EURY|nr:hypothetical protein AKJ43_00925 [candidate division MSBL1 archaeon SCGC-AAA261D19]KXB03105.1 hypothetical protein AKJ45_02495 [candidate division MSBL1 archaeon SCGC-AAA261F19]
MRLAIIGAGSMGKWFAKFSKRSSWNTTITDINIKKAKDVADELDLDLAMNNSEAASRADIVLVAVPVKESPRVIKDVANSVNEGSLLLDITSVKEKVVATMHEIKANFELVSLHPLFGPGAKNMENKIVVSIPIKTGKKYEKLAKHLRKNGAKIVEMGAEDHDRLMMITQSMTHFLLLSYLSALKSMNNFKQAEELHTPISGHLFDLAKAFLNVDPTLCGDLQIENKYAPIARSSILDACRSLDEALEAGNIDVLEDIFKDARELVGSDKVKAAYERLYRKEK